MRLAGIPAYQAYKRRLKHRLESLGPTSESVRIIDVEAIDVPVPDSEPVIIMVETEQLTKSDLDILEDRSKWLNCKLINAGQFLMKKRFPAVQGLHDVTLSSTLSFPSHDRPFVQILNCAESHWTCASNIRCKPNSVKFMTAMWLWVQQKMHQLHSCVAKQRSSIFFTPTSSNKWTIQAVASMP